MTNFLPHNRFLPRLARVSALLMICMCAVQTAQTVQMVGLWALALASGALGVNGMWKVVRSLRTDQWRNNRPYSQTDTDAASSPEERRLDRVVGWSTR